MKLIDADKLLALIDAKIQELGLSGSTWVGRSVLHDLRSDITSLQQWQDTALETMEEKDRIDEGFTKFIQKGQKQLEIKSHIENLLKECVDKPGEYYRGHREALAHLFYYLGGDPTKYLHFIEQPEVDLEKFTEKIKTFQGRHKHPESISIKGAMAFMARMFYQYPNVARLWYEQMPKATMDNARKEK